MLMDANEVKITKLVVAASVKVLSRPSPEHTKINRQLINAVRIKSVALWQKLI
jgi:hypothetical protein